LIILGGYTYAMALTLKCTGLFWAFLPFAFDACHVCDGPVCGITKFLVTHALDRLVHMY
jgi:hypothetical protein